MSRIALKCWAMSFFKCCGCHHSIFECSINFENVVSKYHLKQCGKCVLRTGYTWSVGETVCAIWKCQSAVTLNKFRLPSLLLEWISCIRLYHLADRPPSRHHDHTMCHQSYESDWAYILITATLKCGHTQSKVPMDCFYNTNHIALGQLNVEEANGPWPSAEISTGWLSDLLFATHILVIVIPL